MTRQIEEILCDDWEHLAEETQKSGVSLTELRSGSRRGGLLMVRTKMVRGFVENYRGRRCRSPRGNLDFRGFEDPNENFVQLINSVPTSLPLRNHLEGIVAWAQTRQTNGFLEAINGLFQAAKRKARGYGRFSTIRTVIFLLAGKLDFSKLNPHIANRPI